MSKYEALLQITRQLNAAQNQVDKTRAQSQSVDLASTSRARRANLSDRLTDAVWQRDKMADRLHCELVNLGLVDARPASEYEPREVTQSAGLGHSTRFIYTPPVPDTARQP